MKAEREHGAVCVLRVWCLSALGPGTIVGSAAFNLLFITAVTVMAPAPRIAKVHQYNVYLTTSFFAVEAYMWLLFIVDFHTPERIDLWEVRLPPLPRPLVPLPQTLPAPSLSGECVLVTKAGSSALLRQGS